MIKSDGKAVENVFMGTALALKRSGRLTEQNFLDMLKKLEVDENIYKSKYKSFEIFKNFIFQIEKEIDS
jgi:hypothetical protein